MDDLNIYSYELPEELIAREPLEKRDDSRLLVLDRQSGEIQHRMICDLPEFLHPHDCLVLNDTKVIPARLMGKRTKTGGKWEGLYLNQSESGDWRLIGQTRGHLKSGEQISLHPIHDEASSRELRITLLECNEQGIWTARPDSQCGTFDLLQDFGSVPLPPYIQRKLATQADWERYQTSYASRPGAVAAPTAGLHFTPELLDQCKERGTTATNITLHVGIGTFRPIATERLSDHQMHSEWCELSDETVNEISRARDEGGRILAVGTTTVRTLESAAVTGKLQSMRGETELFIRPPYKFQAIDCLLTNFHLPRSTLLVLVSAFAGTDYVIRAYESAVREGYRFFSYGDAMLII